MLAVQVAVMKGRGGVLTAARHYARMFDAVGTPSLCLYRGPAGDILRQDGVRVVDAPASMTSPFHFLFERGLRRRILDASAGAPPDIIVVHSDKALDAARAAFPEAGIVAVCHSDKFKRKSSADLVITLNEAQHRSAQERLHGPHVACLGNPYLAQPAPPAKPPGGLRFNFVGRFIATKDPLALVHAAARLGKPAPALRFIGDGELAAQIKEAAEAAGMAIETPGWLWKPFADFHDHDVLVSPSHWEGLPYLLQEALDFCVPIIASDIPGNRKALGDGRFGLLAPLGDPGGLAGAMGQATRDLGALQAMAQLGRAAVVENYGARPFWGALTGALDEAKKSQRR